MKERKVNWSKAYRVLKYIQLKIYFKKLDLIRQYQKHEHMSIASLNQSEQKANQGINPLKHACLDWEQVLEDGRLIEALKALTIKQQKVLWYGFVCDLTQKEIAQLLNISHGAVSRIQSRAIKQLRKLASEQDGS
ncbi:sigma-70 family RNA polymerase sigma factor [Ignavigranum ruoffiae]|uniref:sigma-70 family RNA polymerase sigma factor n=1 Tax=Ignavigranum ruoffiae TaxID=89093 RepID=UPI0023551AAB|nr:sigma-70 family RNA polymerase sigma factor [Ignavigranum ruoffiae]